MCGIRHNADGQLDYLGCDVCVDGAEQLFQHRCFGYRQYGGYLYCDRDKSRYGLYGVDHCGGDVQYDQSDEHYTYRERAAYVFGDQCDLVR